MSRSHSSVRPFTMTAAVTDAAFGAAIATFLLLGAPAVAAQSPPTSASPATQHAAEAAEPEPRAKHSAAQVTIDLKPTALMQGHDLRATVKVTPDSNNRLLAVMIDAPHFYASTERELMGAAAPRSYMFKWEKLPAGTYTVVAVVTDATGRLTRVQRDFLVYGGTLDGEMAPTPPTPGRRGRRGRQ